MSNRDLRPEHVTMPLYDGLLTSLQSNDRLWVTSQRLFYVGGKSNLRCNLLLSLHATNKVAAVRRLLAKLDS